MLGLIALPDIAAEDATREGSYKQARVCLCNLQTRGASLLVQTGYWPLSFNVPFKTFTLKPKFLQMIFRQSMRPKPKSLNPKSDTPKSLRPMPYLEAQGTW